MNIMTSTLVLDFSLILPLDVEGPFYSRRHSAEHRSFNHDRRGRPARHVLSRLPGIKMHVGFYTSTHFTGTITLQYVNLAS